MRRLEIETIQDEFAGLSLNDERLAARGHTVVGALAANPSDSFPDQMGSDAELEGLYRFLANPKVALTTLLEPHIAATMERISEAPIVRIVHDTTAFRFSGERDGLGIVTSGEKGFLAHVSLAVAADDTREPLGVLAVLPFVRAQKTTSKEKKSDSQRTTYQSTPRSQRESTRWPAQAIATNDLVPKTTRAIHVVDQEVDSFYAMATMQQKGVSFVVRADPKRRTITNLETKDVLANKPSAVFRTIRVTERKHYKNRRNNHPLRAERDAALELRWGPITLKRGYAVDHELDELHVNAVHVYEPTPPAGEEQIEWMLFTTEKVTTIDEASAIVDHYRARWIIEEYFKALKTGCAFEKRQLTSFDALTKALALFVPIAWHLLLLRHLARVKPSRSARSIVDSEQLLLLRALLVKRRYKLAEDPNVRDVMLAIARLGGHIRNNGDPGWMVLGRGYKRFAEAEEVWGLARSDQS